MNLSGAEARQELGITDEDVARIRRSERNPNKLLLLLVGALASIVGFLLGYVLDMENHIGYPYASIGLGASVVALKRRRHWLALIGIVVAALVSFAIGALVADPPNYGLSPEYSVYSKSKMMRN